MLADTFAPMFPIDLVANDFRYATSAGANVPITSRAGAVFHDAAERGLGSENITAVAKSYR